MLESQLVPQHIAVEHIKSPGLMNLILRATRHKINILHLHWLHPFFVNNIRAVNKIKIAAIIKLAAFITQLIILRLLGVKVVWTAHNIKDHLNRNPVLDRFCTGTVIKLSDAIIAHCDVAKNELNARFPGMDARKVQVIPHGNFIGYYENSVTRQQARNTLKLPQEAMVFLCLGHIRPNKGIPELIEAFKALPGDNNYLVIAGAPVRKRLIKDIQTGIRGHDHILFHPGYIPDDQIQAYMNASDAVVFPYRDILTSGAAILAMSFGRACIGPPIGCMQDILDPAGCFFFDTNRKESLQEVLQQAMNSKDALSEMGRHNYDRVQQMNWELVGQLTARLYRTISQEGTG